MEPHDDLSPNLYQNPYFLEEDDLRMLLEEVEEQGEADWKRFLGFAEEVALEPGDVVIKQFDVDRVVYILVDGEMDVLVAAEPGAPEEKIATVKSVAIIGEQTFLDGQPRTATIAAATPGTIFRLSMGAFDRLRTEEPEIACAFLFDVSRALSLRNRPLQEQASRRARDE